MFFHFSVKGFHVGEVAKTLDVILELFPKRFLLGYSVFQVVEQFECFNYGTTGKNISPPIKVFYRLHEWSECWRILSRTWRLPGCRPRSCAAKAQTS